MKDPDSFSFNILGGSATLTDEKRWFKIVVIILLAISLIGLALILREWAGLLIIKKFMSEFSIGKLSNRLKVGSP